MGSTVRYSTSRLLQCTLAAVDCDLASSGCSQELFRPSRPPFLMSRLSSVLSNRPGFQNNNDYFGYTLCSSPPDDDDDHFHHQAVNRSSINHSIPIHQPSPSPLPIHDFGGFCPPASLRKLAMISRLAAAASNSNTAPSSPNLAGNGPNGLVSRTIPRHHDVLLPPPATTHLPSFGNALKALQHDVDGGSQPSTGPPSVTFGSMPSTAPGSPRM